MAASRPPRPRRRVRVFGCCLPIPLGIGLVAAAGLAFLRRTHVRHTRP
jgi:hypothetical protein